MAITAKQRLLLMGGRFNPLRLFSAGEQGAWYDPSDFSTLFQDAAGTTPVTAVGQAVKKILDKSGRGNHASHATGSVLQQDATGRFYLDFNGTTNTLATAAINFAATDKITAFAGLRKLSDAVTMVFELSPTADTNVGSFALLTYANEYAQRVKGSVANYIEIDYANGTAPVSHVVTASYSLAAASAVTAATLRINAAPVAGASAGLALPPLGGNFGSYSLYLGSRAGASLFHNGRLYGLIVRGAESSQEIAMAERYMNGKTGAY
jgi:hypothetical protein